MVAPATHSEGMEKSPEGVSKSLGIVQLVVTSEIFAGQPNPELSDGFMKIRPYETQSASLIVKDIQSVEPSVDVYGPEILFPIEARHIPGGVQSEQSLVAPYQFTQQPEAESDFTLQTRNPKVKSNKALILNICPLKNKNKK
tara:strand:- start:173 stop:598 length:426 start_codon:yes stop_codon:yes gene_type:complete